ncbi:hypothetical protein D3C74_245360 [compost metagenome]
MTKLLNLKEVSKRINESGKRGVIIWTRDEGGHFISNRHFLLRLTQVPSAILIALFSIFLKVPEIGETLIINFGVIEDPNGKNIKPIDYSKIYKPEAQQLEGQVTSFLKDVDSKTQMRVISFSDQFKFVNEKYMKMADDKTGKSDSGPFSPIYLADDSLMLLPYKVNQSPEEENILKKLGDVIE